MNVWYYFFLSFCGYRTLFGIFSRPVYTPQMSRVLVVRFWPHVRSLIILSFTKLVTGVGSETFYTHINQDIVRKCANNTLDVERRRFCTDMSQCILSSVSEVVKANMATGSVIMGLLPTTVWLIANNMEDVVSIARRDPGYGFVMAIAAAGASGLARNGRSAEVEAGSWWVDLDLPQYSAHAVVVPGLLNETAHIPTDRVALAAFELGCDGVCDMAVCGATRYLVYCMVVSEGAVSGHHFSFIPPLCAYLAMPLIEYRDYWCIADRDLICYIHGAAPPPVQREAY